jgi:hypothetical protein
MRHISMNCKASRGMCYTFHRPARLRRANRTPALDPVLRRPTSDLRPAWALENPLGAVYDHPTPRLGLRRWIRVQQWREWSFAVPLRHGSIFR